MCYDGFWTYRESTDIIFVITDGEDWVREHFSEFCHRILRERALQVQRYDETTSKRTVDIDWSKLTCIAVQVKKVMDNRRKSSGKNEGLHVHFFFDSTYIQTLKLFHFDARRYQNQLQDMKTWWKRSGVSSPHAVADPGTKFDEVVVDGLIVKDGYALVPDKLPEKNIYVVTSVYRDTFLK